MVQHCQATDLVNFLIGDESWFFLECRHYGIVSASHSEMTHGKDRRYNLTVKVHDFDQFVKFWNP
jgi:hypothetical protein